MAEIGIEPDPDPESKFGGTGFGVLVFGAAFGVNFSDSAHPWFTMLYFLLVRQAA